MESANEHDTLEAALADCGSTWGAAQAHGLLCSRLAVAGIGAGVTWIGEVLEQARGAAREACEAMLDELFDKSFRQLAERRSEFDPLLPDDSESAGMRAEALAHWCEGFLHGLVTGNENAALRARLAEEPLASLIRDMLQITRASADADDDEETNETAYVELVEYVRVAAQLAYEELAPFRTPLGAAEQTPPDEVH